MSEQEKSAGCEAYEAWMLSEANRDNDLAGLLDANPFADLTKSEKQAWESAAQAVALRDLAKNWEKEAEQSKSAMLRALYTANSIEGMNEASHD